MHLGHLAATPLRDALQRVLGLLAWSVLVVRVLTHMQFLQSLSLLAVRPPLFLRQQLPSSAQLLGDLCVVGVGRILDNFPPLHL